jgi:hypothetical protein
MPATGVFGLIDLIKSPLNDKITISSLIPFRVFPSITHTLVPALLPLLGTFLKIVF